MICCRFRWKTTRFAHVFCSISAIVPLRFTHFVFQSVISLRSFLFFRLHSLRFARFLSFPVDSLRSSPSVVQKQSFASLSPIVFFTVVVRVAVAPLRGGGAPPRRGGAPTTSRGATATPEGARRGTPPVGGGSPTSDRGWEPPLFERWPGGPSGGPFWPRKGVALRGLKRTPFGPLLPTNSPLSVRHPF